MSYEAEAAKLSRRPFTFVRLDFDNPLSAQGFEYHCTDRPPHGQQMFETIDNKTGIDPVPTRIDYGSGLGYRANIRITFNDFNYGAKGTYWGKLLASNIYYQDRKLTLYEGFYDGGTFSLSDFKQKLYFINKITGPDSNGKVVITASSILTLLDNDKAKVPDKTDGVLAGALAAATTGTVNIGDNTGFNASGGVCVINSEYIRYSGVSGADSIVITSRGQFGTTAADHSAGDDVNDCFYFEDDNVVDVIYRLIDEQSPIDASTYINTTEWNAQRDDYLPTQYVTGVILPQEDTKDIIEKLCMQGYIALWWSEDEQLLKLKAIGPTVASVKSLNQQNHILNIGEKPERNSKDAISAVLIHYGIINPEEDHDDPTNYQSHYYQDDAAALAGLGLKIKTVFADFIPNSGTGSVSRLASRLLSQFKKGELKYTFILDAKDVESLPVGDRAQISTDKIQDSNGDNEINDFFVIERERQSDPSRYKYLAIATGFLIEAGYRKIAPDSMSSVTYATATTQQRIEYGFIADTSTVEMSNGDPPTLIL